MVPEWLRIVAVLHVFASFAASVWVVADISLYRHRQPTKIMEAVWPLTLLYWGPLGLIFYLWFGRTRGAPVREDNKLPMWKTTFKGAAHCGAGCAPGEFVDDWLAFGSGLMLFGSEFVGKLVAGFSFAYLFGVGFQYFSVAPMRHLQFVDGLVTAIKIDTLSLLAYEIGMFAFMTYRTVAFPGLGPTDWSYWFMMQIATVVGFFTTFPVNWWLIRKGIKERK